MFRDVVGTSSKNSYPENPHIHAQNSPVPFAAKRMLSTESKGGRNFLIVCICRLFLLNRTTSYAVFRTHRGQSKLGVGAVIYNSKKTLQMQRSCTSACRQCTHKRKRDVKKSVLALSHIFTAQSPPYIHALHSVPKLYDFTPSF